MDLPTHFAFGFAAGLVFTDNTQIAFLVALGSLIPDLDREYWFIPRRIFSDDQLHRAAFHNVFMMALIYIASPYLSLGIFLHILADSFTTVKDRGVEWFFPVTRLGKRGRFNCVGEEQPVDKSRRVYYYQEDPPGLVKKADPDLQEQHECYPLPWRRVYGFGLNGQILDKTFLVASVGTVLIWYFAPGNLPHFVHYIQSPPLNYLGVSLGIAAVLCLFFSGEIARHALKPSIQTKVRRAKYPVFLVGIALLVISILLSTREILANASDLFSNPVPAILFALMLPASVIIVVKLKTRHGRTAMI